MSQYSLTLAVVSATCGVSIWSKLGMCLYVACGLVRPESPANICHMQ